MSRKKGRPVKLTSEQASKTAQVTRNRDRASGKIAKDYKLSCSKQNKELDKFLSDMDEVVDSFDRMEMQWMPHSSRNL